MNIDKLNNIQVFTGKSYSNSTRGKKRKYETTHPEQSSNKLSCTNKQLCDFSELCRNNYVKSKEQLETLKGAAQSGKILKTTNLKSF